jgi:hypothetical protein
MSSLSETEPDRLNGWKEIAVHLGKGTRTVQRWEKLYGLPVHRLGREGGEIVFAFRDEIDRWMKASAREREAAGEADAGPEGAPPEPGPAPGAPARPRRWWPPLLLLLAAGAVAGLLAASATSPPGTRATGREPSSWRLSGESLVVYDAAGAVLFEHRFGFPLDGTWTAEGPPPLVGPMRALVTDVDGDGRSEVLVHAPAAERSHRRLYCFEADGRLRFVHQPKGSRRFGDDVYGEPWVAHRTFSTRGEDGRRRLWAVFTHNLLFPAVVQELDPQDGAVRQEYWSSGYVEFVQEATWAGRRVLLVGGTNNDFRAASLAVFPVDALAGSTPAVRPGYACRDCAAGGPEALFLFPTLCAARRNGQAGLHAAWVESGDRLRVTVGQPLVPVEGELHATYYTLGPDGTLVNAEISRELQALHARLEREGTLDHPFGPRDDAEVLPVTRWDGRRFVDLPPVRVAH